MNGNDNLYPDIESIAMKNELQSLKDKMEAMTKVSTLLYHFDEIVTRCIDHERKRPNDIIINDRNYEPQKEKF